MEDLHRYLANNHGVLTRAQAIHLGLSNDQIRRRLRTGEFVRVGPKVFRLATAPDTWKSRARAAALAARGLVSHTSAFRVWAVDGHLSRMKVHILVGGTRRPRTPNAVVHRSGSSQVADGHLVDGIPVTSPARALVDSASLLTAEELDVTIDALVRKGLASLDELIDFVRRSGTAGRKGTGRLKRLLDERDLSARVPDSRFNRLVGSLLVDAGLPTPTFEHEVRIGERPVARVDLAYPVQRLAIECDSRRWHHNRRSFIADPRRRNQLVVAGYQVLNFTWDDYANRPAQVVKIVAAALDEGLDAAVSL